MRVCERERRKDVGSKMGICTLKSKSLKSNRHVGFKWCLTYPFFFCLISIHPSSAAYSGLGSWGQQPKQGRADFPLSPLPNFCLNCFSNPQWPYWWDLEGIKILSFHFSNSSPKQLPFYSKVHNSQEQSFRNQDDGQFSPNVFLTIWNYFGMS